jgi:hypothetical protein
LRNLPEHPLDRNGAEASNSGVAGDIIATRFGLAIAACIAIGVLIRAFHILSSDFPLNDGGLFFAMTQDLQAADYVLPTNTSYNGGDIPFAYPPFGLYFAGLVDQLTPLSLVDALRFVPLLVTSLTIPAFYLLARSILNTQAAVVASVFAFAAIPRAYIWLLMGGGVTRSFGLLFALLALYQVCRVLKERKSSTVLWASLFCGLTVLSHLETAWFLAFSVAIFFLTWGRSRQALNSCLIIMVGTVVIAAPWWGLGSVTPWRRALPSCLWDRGNICIGRGGDA